MIIFDTSHDEGGSVSISAKQPADDVLRPQKYLEMFKISDSGTIKRPYMRN